MYAGVVCSSAPRSLPSDMGRAITAVFGVYEYVTNALPAGRICIKHERTRKAVSSAFELTFVDVSFEAFYERDTIFFEYTFLYDWNKNYVKREREREKNIKAENYTFFACIFDLITSYTQI